MAKFCGNCGAKLDDNAKVCGKCGTPLDGVSTNISDLKIVDPDKQKKVKKLVKLIVVLAALAVAATTIFNIISKRTGYNGLLRKVMTAYEKYDIDTLISLSSDMYYSGDKDFVEYYFENTVGDSLDAFESSVGHNYKLSYEVNETYVMSKRMADEVLNKLENTYSKFDTSVIDKIVVANLTITAKQGNKSVERDIDVSMSKENGTWKLLYIK